MRINTPSGEFENYREYIASQEWRRRRRAFLRKFPYCNRCGMDNDEHYSRYGVALNVHHKSYARIGNEFDEDLETLCRGCHLQEENSTQEYINEVTGSLDWLYEKLHRGEGEQESDTGTHITTSPPSVGLNASSSEYWEDALERVTKAKKQFTAIDDEFSWTQIHRLNFLENFVRACMGEELDAWPEGHE